MYPLLQFYQSTPSNFIITNMMCTPIESMQTNSTANENISNEKERASSNKQYFNCTHPDCGKSFRYKSEFIRHKLTHASQRRINCPVEGCEKTFKRDDILKTHMRIHTGEAPYKCEVTDCGQSFTNRASLRYHGLKHIGEKEHKCSFPGCNKTFLVMSQLKKHEHSLYSHKRFTTQTPSQDENEEEYINPVKIRKCENTIFSAPSIAQETDLIEKLKVGVEETIIKEENTRNFLEDEFERMVKALVYQNSVMKIKLNRLNRLREQMLKNKNMEITVKSE